MKHQEQIDLTQNSIPDKTYYLLESNADVPCLPTGRLCAVQSKDNKFRIGFNLDNIN